MDYVWCHGPKCHKSHTQDRIRGVKGSKVLRTRKIAQNNWNTTTQWSHFCSQGCYTDFMHKHFEATCNIEPRIKPLETQIEDPKKVGHEGWNGRTYYNTEITKKEVDNRTELD